MNNVTLDIGGRQYTVACAAGEEAHLRQMGAMIDSKLTVMPPGLAQSEIRTLLFACLLLADELHETRKPPAPAESAPDWPAQVDATAAHIENLTQRLFKAP